MENEVVSDILFVKEKGKVFVMKIVIEFVVNAAYIRCFRFT